MAARRDPRFQVRFKNASASLAEVDYGWPLTNGDSPLQRAANKVRAFRRFIV
jgi:hypothetical protein